MSSAAMKSLLLLFSLILHQKDLLTACQDDDQIVDTPEGVAAFVQSLNEKFNCSSLHFPRPQCPNENITFWYFSRSADNVELNVARPETFNSIPADRGPEWKLLVHGFGGCRDSDVNNLREGLKNFADYNIISVEFSKLLPAPCFEIAVRIFPAISECIANLIDALIERRFFGLRQLHVLGFAYGAHVAGQIKPFLKRNEQIPRITGLDPDGITFEKLPTSQILNPSSAAFVDVIHTNAGLEGINRTLGTVDFFPNGGASQPGCTPLRPAQNLTGCEHLRGIDYFDESLTTRHGFWAVPCDSYDSFKNKKCTITQFNQILMGLFTPNNVRGKYYLKTKSTSPYAEGRQQSNFPKIHPFSTG